MRIEKFVFGPVGTNCYIVINEMTSECFAAVSYTHLDVYKRQSW